MSANPELETDEPQEAIQPELKIVASSKPADFASLYSKIAAVMGDVQRVEKTKSVDNKYKVATGDDLLDMLRPIMGKHKIVCIPNMDDIEIIPEPKDGMVRYRGHFTFTIADGETGQSIQREWLAETRDNNWSDKTINKVSRIATRYFLTNLFQLSTGDAVDDGDLTTTDHPQQQQSPYTPIYKVDTPLNGSAQRRMDDTPKPTGSTNNLAFKGLFSNFSSEDATRFWSTIKPLYDSEFHKFGSLNKMWDSGELTADMDVATAIASVESHLKQKETEKANKKSSKGLTADEWESLATQFIDQSEAQLLELLDIEKRQDWKDGLDTAIDTIREALALEPAGEADDD